MKKEDIKRDYKDDHGASCHTARVHNFLKLSPKFFVTLLLPMAMLFSLPASATSYDIPGYHVQLLPPPPGSIEFAQSFGFNNKGIIVGISDVEAGGWMYDMKTGAYTTIDDFQPLAINNNGLMAGSSLAGNCAIRNINGDVTEFSTPSLEAAGEPCNTSARAVNERGKVNGFEILTDGTWFGYVYDSKKDVTEEYLANPVRTIAQGITSSGAIVGTTAVDGERVAFLRDKHGSLKTFLVSEADAIPGLSNARGISENGKLISGFYTSFPDFEAVGFVAESSGLSKGPGHVDLDVTVLEISPCNPDSSPPAGWVSFTDTFAQAIRNDGVIVGQCGDVYWEGSAADPDFLNLIFDYGYTFIATPPGEEFFGVPLAINFTPTLLVDQLLVEVADAWLTDPTISLDIEITGINGGFASHGTDLIDVVDTNVFSSDGTVAQTVVDWTTDTTSQNVNEVYFVCVQVLRNATVLGLEHCGAFGPF